MVWNPGDDTDLNEGGGGADTVEVNGGNGAEVFATTANGARVRFDRLDPAPFAIDIGTSENLVLNANGGDDTFSATGNLAALIAITVDGGAGNDTILGGNGVDLLLGGEGNDFVDGQQGNDVAFLGAGDDSFQWDPGDGSDTIEGQDGTDTMVFNGSGAAWVFDTSGTGQRLRFTRNLGNIVMDTDNVELRRPQRPGRTDPVTVNDLSGTDVVEFDAELAAVGGGDDLAADNVVGEEEQRGRRRGRRREYRATNVQFTGFPALVSASGAIAGSDRFDGQRPRRSRRGRCLRAGSQFRHDAGRGGRRRRAHRRRWQRRAARRPG